MPSQIDDKINQALKDKEIRPKQYYTRVNILKMIGLAFMSLLVISLLSYFVWDTWWKYDLIHSRVDFWEVLRSRPYFILIGLPSWELVFLSFLGMLGIRSLYRTTDWPFVRNTTGLSIAIACILVFVGVGIAVSGREVQPIRRPLERVRERIQEDSPLFERRRRQIDRVAPERRPTRPRR